MPGGKKIRKNVPLVHSSEKEGGDRHEIFER